ncbi:MAG: hypothetical protein EOO28_19195 [Comamonadaceae bacterium]|nr:MAG: hypothetical protein EOO28_19195 [Comamonadaceae bacterium]
MYPTPPKTTSTRHSSADDRTPQPHTVTQPATPRIAQAAHGDKPPRPARSDSLAIRALRGARRPDAPPVERQKLELPEPPALSDNGERISQAMAKNFAELSRRQSTPERTAALAEAYFNGVRATIRDHEVPAERADLVAKLREHLAALDPSMQTSEAWQAGLKQLDRLEHPEVESATQFRNQTTKALQLMARYIGDPGNDDYNPALLPEKMPLLDIQIARIRRHQPASEQYSLAVHMAQELSAIVHSDAAAAHPVQRLMLATFLATTLDTAAVSMGATAPHNATLREELAALMATHRAAVANHPRKILGERLTDIFRLRSPSMVQDCIGLVHAIGWAPLVPADKKALLEELHEEVQAMLGEHGANDGKFQKAASDIQEIFRGLRAEFQDATRWPDPSLYRFLNPYLNNPAVAEKRSSLGNSKP